MPPVRALTGVTPLNPRLEEPRKLTLGLTSLSEEARSPSIAWARSAILASESLSGSSSSSVSFGREG